MPNPLQDNPFLQVTFIDRVIGDLVVTAGNYSIIDQYIPTIDQDPRLGTSYKWDIEIFDEGGMTALSGINSKSSLITGGGLRQKEYSPAHFREGVRLDGSDFLNIRMPGSQTEQITMAQLVVKWVARLLRRIDNRKLWLKWQSVQSAAAFNLIGAGIIHQVDYSMYGFHPTYAPLWDAPGATVLDDIIDTMALFRTTGCKPVKAFFGTSVLQALLQDTTMRNIIQEQIFRKVNETNIFNPLPGAEGVTAFLKSMFAGMEFQYYSDGPPVALKVTKAATGTTLPVAGPTELFRVGETVDHVLPNGTRTSVVITAVSSVLNTITFAALAVASPRGTLIRKRLEFMNYDQFTVFTEMPMGQLGGQEQAKFITVANIHAEGGLDNPKSGVASRVIRRLDDDPPYVKILASFTGGVVVLHEDGPWGSAKALT